MFNFSLLFENSQEKHIFLKKTKNSSPFSSRAVVYKVNNILLLKQLTNESKSNSGQFAQDENQTQHACQENVTLLWTYETWNSKFFIWYVRKIYSFSESFRFFLWHKCEMFHIKFCWYYKNTRIASGLHSNISQWINRMTQ